jgi:cyclic beta-1,2-glucan synthetase
MARLGLEAMLGLRRAGDALHVAPCIPRDWSDYQITYRFGDSVYRIRVENPHRVSSGVVRVVLDGEDLPEGAIPLVDDGREHLARVVMG